MHLRQPQVPTIDVLEAARAADDPPGADAGGRPGADAAGDAAVTSAAPLLVDVREHNEFVEARAGGPSSTRPRRSCCASRSSRGTARST
jgi:hypothetical protein